MPSRAGEGLHPIAYTVDDTLPASVYTLANGQATNLICPATTKLTVNVRSLPIPKMTAPTNNSSFCSNDMLQTLIPAIYDNRTWNFFQDTAGAVSFRIDSILIPVGGGNLRWVVDTTFYFDPGVGQGTYSITYFATDSTSGCSDSLDFTLRVDGYEDASFVLDSVHCESDDRTPLTGSPSGGVFTRNGNPIVGVPPTMALYFYPNQGYASGQFLSSAVYDTIVYSYSRGACSGADTQTVVTYPVPQISFTTAYAHNTYCLGGDTVWLMTTDTGGVFSGSGVPFQSNYFIPDLAGGGEHAISYYYVDSISGCDNRFTDTLFVYSMPTLDFAIDGGCQFDSIYFKPNNGLLGLINNSQVVDSLTSVLWIVSPTDSIIGSTQNGATIDTVGFSYNSAGVYYPQLIVANRVHCVDTQTVRLVISPKVDSFPYEQDFEANDGDWFAESKDSSHRLLWQWGFDNNNLGVAQDLDNKIWATQTSNPYSRDEAAWVYSPCFDISTLSRPMISMDYWSHSRAGFDGTVLEYQREDGTWAPLGKENRGIDWFNTSFIAGQPGSSDHRVFPLGWSGLDTEWQNGRYKLDDFRGRDSIVRLRVAFASLDIDPGGLYDGFAFDNVVVRNRTRNVLLETMVNDGHNNMENINNALYQLIFHTSLKEDVVLLQYHMESPNVNDAFYLNNPTLGRNRAFQYSLSPAGRSFIDGLDSTVTYTTNTLTDADFEQDMLESPKFKVEITRTLHINNTFDVTARVEALDSMPLANYRIYTVISEDSLRYPNGSSYTSEVHAVARENDQFHLNSSVNATTYEQSWAKNETKFSNFLWNHSGHAFINYDPGDFQVVVFIQNTDTKEVFQVATTRDVSGYTTVNVDPIQAAKELNEIENLVLYPNPAHDYFNVKFDQAR